MSTKPICKSISAVIAVCFTFHTGCSGGADDVQFKGSQKSGKDGRILILPPERGTSSARSASSLSGFPRTAARADVLRAGTSRAPCVVSSTPLVVVSRCARQRPKAASRIDCSVVCTFNVTNKTVCVLPWEKENLPSGVGDAALLKRDKPRILDWGESTLLVSEGNALTIAQCMQGKPLSTDCKRLTDLEGELTRLHIETVRGRDVVRKVEALGAFDRDTIPVQVGTNTVQAVGGPVKCVIHK